MSKRIIAFLVTIALVMSMLPLAALAEETVTPDEVGEAIDQAQSSAVEASVASAASGQVQTAVDEALAVANEQLAENKLDAAQSVVEGTDAANAERAEDAKEAAGDAADAADKAAEDAAAAADAKKAAEDVLDAAKDATSKGEAVNAAEKAEEASAAADKAAADAQVQSAVAAQKAQDAKDAYEAAKKAAEEADAEAKELLASGLINMEEAEKRTAEAAQRAQAKYDEMVAAEKVAEEAATAAKAEADAAKEVLDTAAKELEQAIVDNAVNVAEKTATAVVTGAALAASKVAVEVAGKVVESYEGDLAELNQQVDELDAAIEEAKGAIKAAEDKLSSEQLGDAEYQSALAELETAKAAQEKAEAALEMSKKLLEAKNNADSDLAKQKSEIDTLRETIATEPTNTEAVVKLTEEVLGNELSDDKLGEITWVNKDEGVFSVKGENGVTQYYKAVPTMNEEDGTYYLQFCKAEQKNETVDVLPEASGDGTELFPQYKPTSYKAIVGDNEYDVKIKCTVKYSWTGKRTVTYSYVVNNKQLDYNADTKTFSINGTAVTVEDSSKTVFEPGAPLTTNSNTIDNKWENAEEIEAKDREAVQSAVDKVTAANQKYEEVHEPYLEAEAALEKMKGEQVSRQETVDNLNQQVAELDKKLNGDLADQLLRGVIQIAIGEEPETSVADVAMRKLHLEAKKALANLPFGGEPLTPEEEKELAELQSVNTGAIVDSGEEMLNIIIGLRDGVDLDDVKNTIDLLANSGVSAKTRQAILKAVEQTLDAAHAQAAKDLSKAIEDAKQELAEKGQAVGAAAQDYADKELIFLEAAAKETLAEAAVSNAANLKDKAVKAHEDAKAALEAYEKLANNNETDKSLVEAAKKAYEDASKKADEALKAANEAIKNAIAAAQAALEARKIVNTFPEEEEYIETTYRNLGLTIARYAYSLVGPLVPGFSENNDAMTNAEFVRLVYARFGIKLDLSSTKPEDVAKNGVRIDNKMVKPGDLVCIHAENGMVGTFGIYYGEGTYVFYNETSREVELGTCAQITNGWFVVRVVW